MPQFHTHALPSQPLSVHERCKCVSVTVQFTGGQVVHSRQPDHRSSPSTSQGKGGALTSSARAAVREDTLFFSFMGVRPPRRTGSLQVLLSLAFPGHSRFSLALDRVLGQEVFQSMVQIPESEEKEVEERREGRVRQGAVLRA
ncbi:hypothetical protein E2C01_048119 [Portunus trituberculatus]|uniref:Uncharacterized protein n=1 Tax=Portunus trituberculatus TaxID=210409 RepID=A0A5B7G2U7_PORTR|nr:hypothetical protein [Portunus trituberculatus]